MSEATAFLDPVGYNRASMAAAPVDVRDATIGDVSRLVCLYRRAYGENERMGFPSSMTTLEPETVREWLRTRSVFVADREGKVVGCVHLVPRDDWQVPELGRLVVAPAHQGAGIGNRLLTAAEDAARSRGDDRLRLRALSGHPFLEDWYRRRGYRRVGIEHLGDRPYDARIMETEL